MNRIGERIKKKREIQKLHLNELAEKVGVSSSALSQIEKAKSFPSIVTLKSIAESLHTTVGELIGENESLVNNPVVYKKDLKLMDQNESGTQIFHLSHHDGNKNMDTYKICVSKDGNVKGLFTNPIGQIFCHLLNGKVEFTLEEKTFTLETGDNIYFNAKMPFQINNKQNDVSEILWIQSPPNF